MGTNAFIDRLQAHLMDRFVSMHKISDDISKNARTVAKFRREASRVFKILSANKEISSMVIHLSHFLNQLMPNIGFPLGLHRVSRLVF